MAEFNSRNDVERWLQGKTRGVAVVIAARAALRVAPLLVATVATRGRGLNKAGRDVILPVFCAIAAPWVAGNWPTRIAEILTPAAAAAFRATAAAAADTDATDAVFSAVYAAEAVSAADAVSAAAVAALHAINAAADFAPRAVFAGAPATAQGAAALAALTADTNSIDSGAQATELAIQPLWVNGIPGWANEAWQRLEQALLNAREDWEVWTQWYVDRLKGSRGNETLEVARVMIANDIWKQGPKAVNPYIKRLIEEHTSPPEAQKGEDVIERVVEKPPAVPPQRHAAIEPVWQDGRLKVPTEPAKTDLDKKEFAAALTALRAEMREFAGDVAGEANIDKRFVSFLQRLADRVPEKPPAQDDLFRLGHAEEILVGYAKTVDQEWPDVLASRYHAVSLQFERTLRQSPLWREFKRNAAKETLSAEQVAASTELAREAAGALRREEANEFVDPALPGSLELLAEISLSANDPKALDAIATDQALLAADLIESVNNTLKPIAEMALSAANQYAEGFGKGFKKAAKKQGPIDGEKAFKWLRRLALGGAASGGSFVTLSSLLAKYPESFSWLARVLNFLF